MTFSTSNNTADNGYIVNTVIELLIPKHDEPFAAKPWRVTCTVNSSPLFTSHSATRSEADKTADRMHKAYLMVHNKKGN